MRTIAVATQKGGSGKTTTAVNLAAALAERGRRVVVLDLDPQCSASRWLGAEPAADDRQLLDVLTRGASLPALLRDTPLSGLAVIPGSPWLVAADAELSTKAGREVRLRKALSGLSSGAVDVVLIDCPPQLGLLTISALAAADGVLVPLEASAMALDGLRSLEATVADVRDVLNPALTLDAVVLCRVDYRTRLSGDVEARARDLYGATVCATVIRENVRLAEAPSYQQPITAYDTASAGAADYRALAGELEGRWWHTRKRSKHS